MEASYLTEELVRLIGAVGRNPERRSGPVRAKRSRRFPPASGPFPSRCSRRSLEGPCVDHRHDGWRLLRRLGPLRWV
jgi:hypothetical protein